MDRFAQYVSSLLQCVSGPSGRADARLRDAVRTHVHTIVGGTSRVPAELPDPLVPYVETVARHAYKVIDDNVDRVRQAGYSDDEIFDVTVNAAVAAGLARLARGLELLREGR